MSEMELTILMPCLNEEKSLAFCIKECQNCIKKNGIYAEILIADNGSSDSSVRIARECGVRVVQIPEKGYGNAVRGGIREARGRYVIMGDCDGSYDFSESFRLLEKLREGFGLVVGSRYLGGIEKGAMPFLHRCIGVPFLSMLGRWRYKVEISDFHCGLRGFDRKTARRLGLKSEGMEFATELIGRFAQAGEKICEVPVRLRRDKRGGRSHLRTVPDGFRHLRLIFKGK